MPDTDGESARLQRRCSEKKPKNHRAKTTGSWGSRSQQKTQEAMARSQTPKAGEAGGVTGADGEAKATKANSPGKNTLGSEQFRRPNAQDSQHRSEVTFAQATGSFPNMATLEDTCHVPRMETSGRHFESDRFPLGATRRCKEPCQAIFGYAFLRENPRKEVVKATKKRGYPQKRHPF